MLDTSPFLRGLAAAFSPSSAPRPEPAPEEAEPTEGVAERPEAKTETAGGETNGEDRETADKGLEDTEDRAASPTDTRTDDAPETEQEDSEGTAAFSSDASETDAAEPEMTVEGLADGEFDAAADATLDAEARLTAPDEAAASEPDVSASASGHVDGASDRDGADAETADPATNEASRDAAAAEPASGTYILAASARADDHVADPDESREEAPLEASREVAAVIEDAAEAPLAVEEIDTLEDFRALRADWEALEARDPEATLFLSWSWLERALARGPARWRIYLVRAAEPQGALVAAFPVTLRTRWHTSARCFRTGLTGGIRHGAGALPGEVSGLLLDPAAGDDALRALAAALAAAPWAELALADPHAPARLRRFAATFPAEGFALRETLSPQARADAVRPVLVLPETFETWLQTRPAPGVARRIRTFGRRHLATGARRLTLTDAGSFERDADLLLAPQLAAWTAAQGAEAAGVHAAEARAVLARALDADALLLAVLWEGTRPLGALAHALDHEMDRVHVLMGGGLAADAPASVGTLLHAESIRWAIEHGFSVYDFGRGAAPYKTAFGARDTEAPLLRLRRSDLGSGGHFDPATLGDALRGLRALSRAGQHEQAAAAAEQLAALVD